MDAISQTTFSNGFFFNENVWIPIKISLKFVPKGTNNYIPALVQIMAWRLPGDKPLSETTMVRLLILIYASLGLNELTLCRSKLHGNTENILLVSVKEKFSWGPFYYLGLTLIQAMISNHIHYSVWDEITYAFPNFNGGIVEVWESKSNFIPHFTRHVITYPFWD